MSDVLKNLLKKVYSLSDEKITALLEKGDEEQTAEILTLDAARVAKFNDATTKAHDKGHAKAKAEVLAQQEAQLREKYNIEDENLKGDALFDAIVQGATTKAGKDKLNDDAVKAHPLYVQLQEDSKKAVKAATKEWEEKYNNREAELATGQRVGKAKNLGNDYLEKSKPILPKNPDVANNLKNLYAAEFEKYDYDFQDNGQTVIKTKDGKVLEDAHGNRVTFDDFTKGIAGKFFEFPASTERGNAGNGNDGSGSGAAGQGGTGNGNAGTYAAPKTMAELAAMIDDPKIPADVKENFAKMEFPAA